jgi:hypothetical protein
VPQPARDEQLAALLAHQRLPAGDSRPPRLPLRDQGGPFPAVLAQHPPVRAGFGPKRPASNAHEHGWIVAYAANANADEGEEPR